MAAVIIVSAYAVNIAVNLLTSRMQVTGGSGMLLLGLGETSRSVVLLAAVVSGAGRPAQDTFSYLPGAIAGVADGGARVADPRRIAASIQRLLFGGLAYLVCFAFAVGLLMPATCVTGLTGFAGTLRGRGD